MESIFLVYSIFVFLFGLIIGSFLNCVIYRIEKGESFVKGRSYCPHCKHTLRWLDLVPVFSFLLLRGKCRYCHAKISVQYPLIEILTGIVFLLIFAYQFSTVFQVVFLWYIASVFIIIFVYDLKHYIIPDSVLFPAIGITFFYQLIFHFSIVFLSYLLSGLGAAAFFLAIFLVTKGRGMGFGDVKLAILLGLLLGFPHIIVGLFLAFLFGAIIGVILLLRKKKGLKSEVPFAPFLIAGTFIALVWGTQLIHWYTHIII